LIRSAVDKEETMKLTRRRLLGAAAAIPFAATSWKAWSQGASASLPTIRIATLTDLSGPYRDIGGPTSVACTKQAVIDFNPVQHGFNVEVISGDHQNKPDVGVSTVRQWYDRGSVDMVNEINNSAIALALREISVAKNKVQLNSAPALIDLSGVSCTANTAQFSADTWMLANSNGTATVKSGGRKWFFITADYAFGKSLQADTTKFVEAAGGQVVGSAAYPFPETTDFASYLLRAQASGADTVGFANTGADLDNCLKQAAEFGLVKRGIRMVGLNAFVTNIKAAGLDAAQGLFVSEIFYWNLNDRTRAFLDRVKDKVAGNYPNQVHASAYSATVHYLKAVAALGPEKAKASGREVIETMKKMPMDDDAFGPGSLRADGRRVCPVYLFKVKAPDQSKQPWDLYEQVATTPSEHAVRPLAEGGCPLVKT
jgi:branched-chain amino acid transport system substrate-binding protein